MARAERGRGRLRRRLCTRRLLRPRGPLRLRRLYPLRDTERLRVQGIENAHSVSSASGRFPSLFLAEWRATGNGEGRRVPQVEGSHPLRGGDRRTARLLPAQRLPVEERMTGIQRVDEVLRYRE